MESSIEIFESSVAESVEDVGIIEALGLSGLGIALVFAVLIVLMAFIAIVSKVIRGGSKTETAKEPVAAEKAPVQNALKDEAPAVSAAPAPVAAPVSGDADMYVTLNGKKHAVSVEEKLPRFTVTINGNKHSVDVESVEED